MVEGLVQKESFKMIRKRVFVAPTKQVCPQKCHELISSDPLKQPPGKLGMDDKD
jgi:hypothetical protein